MTGSPIDGLDGWRRIDLMSVGSTNAEAFELAEKGAPGKLWVTAGEQLAGRGRRGRDWSSPPGNLYASVLLDEPAPVKRLGALPLVAAIAVRDAIAACDIPQGSDLSIKWPNDILLNGAKCCGMLLESRILGDRRLAVVIGCGVNIVSHPEPGLYKATALNREGVEITAQLLFPHLARAMASALQVWDGGNGVAAIRNRWLAHAHGIGGPVVVNLTSSRIEGMLEGIGADGSLQLKDGQGNIHSVSAGDLFFDTANNSRNPAQ